MHKNQGIQSTSILLHSTCLLLLLSVSSCGFMNKIFTKNKTQTTLHQQTSSDSTSVKKKDSTVATLKDSNHLKKNELLQQHGVDIQFADSSNTNTVEISIDPRGGQTIRANGKVQSLKIQRTKSWQQLDSLQYKKQDQASYQTLDSIRASHQAQTTLDQKSKDITKTKTTWRLPWYTWLLLCILVLLFLYHRFHKKIKNFLKF